MADIVKLTDRKTKTEATRTGLAALPLFVEPAWMKRQDGATANLRRRPYQNWVF